MNYYHYYNMISLIIITDIHLHGNDCPDYYITTVVLYPDAVLLLLRTLMQFYSV